MHTIGCKSTKDSIVIESVVVLLKQTPIFLLLVRCCFCCSLPLLWLCLWIVVNIRIARWKYQWNSNARAHEIKPLQSEKRLVFYLGSFLSSVQPHCVDVNVQPNIICAVKIVLCLFRSVIRYQRHSKCLVWRIMYHNGSHTYLHACAI